MLVKSPVNRIGGKYYLTGWLSEMIPSHVLYCEPFCGAGHLLFSKEFSQVEVLNDTDKHLINFFRVIQHPEKRQILIERLNYMPYSRSLWQDIRGQWKEGNLPDNEIERVSWWFYLNRSTFSGDQERGGFAIPSTTGRNPVTSFRNAVDGLDTMAGRLRGVCIENLDYQECIKRYDSEETLFYADPPYLDTEHYYGDTFTQNDHRTLANLLHGVKGYGMVSHYQNSLYDDLYKGWHRYEYQSFKGSHKADRGTEKPKTVEVLYCNFESRQRGLFNENILV
jgi:DNA adenine methylase